MIRMMRRHGEIGMWLTEVYAVGRHETRWRLVDVLARKFTTELKLKATGWGFARSGQEEELREVEQMMAPDPSHVTPPPFSRSLGWSCWSRRPSLSTCSRGA